MDIMRINKEIENIKKYQIKVIELKNIITQKYNRWVEQQTK